MLSFSSSKQVEIGNSQAVLMPARDISASSRALIATHSSFEYSFFSESLELVCRQHAIDERFEFDRHIAGRAFLATAGLFVTFLESSHATTFH